jgi:transposase-like protein
MGPVGSVEALFKGRQFDQEIIVLCVRWYLRYKLSTRDLVEMMAERGVVLVHTTILSWCSVTCRTLKSSGTDMRGRLAARGGVTRPILG